MSDDANHEKSTDSLVEGACWWSESLDLLMDLPELISKSVNWLDDTITKFQEVHDKGTILVNSVINLASPAPKQGSQASG